MSGPDTNTTVVAHDGTGDGQGRDGSTGALGTLAAAKEYAAAGLDVYPVWQTEEDGRKPKAPACGHGYKDSTRDEAQIARWWGGGSELGVSIRTGAYSRF